MNDKEVIQWLLEGDVSIQYQVYRDLLSREKVNLQKRIALEGWGKKFLSKRNPSGHWGKKFYEPKWISSHYTLLDLRNLEISKNNPLIKDTIDLILEKEIGKDGGVNPSGSTRFSDVCVNGMFLNYASYFQAEENSLRRVIDFILEQWMPDGGFNCRSNREGARHSSLHSTISVLEGITEYQKNGYTYCLSEIEKVKSSSIEFILIHELFLSDRTGKVIQPEFLKLHYPCRWRYDILRALDYFQYEELPWDQRMTKAMEMLISLRKKNNTWNLNAGYPGQVHFQMEKAGKPSRWNTLRALRVLKNYEQNIEHWVKPMK